MPVAVAELPAPLADAPRQDLERIYADWPAGTAADCVAAVAAGATLYTGLFNARHIAAVLVCDSAAGRQLRLLAVHPATRGRGVAERLLAEVRRLESLRGTPWLLADDDVARAGSADLLLALGFIPHAEGGFRCRLLA